MSKDLLEKVLNQAQTPVWLAGVRDGFNIPIQTASGTILAAQVQGLLDANNSTAIPLGADEIFTGTATNTLNYAIVFVTVFSNVASATDGLSVQQSSDGVNWDNMDEYTVPANTGKTYSFQPGALFLRVVYTNGPVAQGQFRLQVILKGTNAKPSSHRIQDAIVSDDDAELVKSVLTGPDINGNFFNFGVDNPQPVIDLNGTTIALGNITGYSSVQKFGYNGGLGVTPQTIWTLNFDYVFPTVASIMTVSSDDVNDVGSVVSSGIATGGSLLTLEDTGATFVTDGVAVGDIVINDTNVTLGVVASLTETEITVAISMNQKSSNTFIANAAGDTYRVITSASTGAALIHIFGLDSNYNSLDEFVVLNGQNAVNTTGTYIRMHRAIIITAGSTGANEGGVYVGTGAVAGGVPANVYTHIQTGKNQTLQAFFTIPAGKSGYVTRWYMSVGTGKELDALLQFRPFGEVFQVKQEFSIVQNTRELDFPVPLRVEERTDIRAFGNLTSTPAVSVASAFDMILIDNV